MAEERIENAKYESGIVSLLRSEPDSLHDCLELRKDILSVLESEHDVLSGQIPTNEGAVEMATRHKTVTMLKSKLAKLDTRIKEFEAESEQQKKNFDKALFIENLRELLKISGTKIGQIEKEAGCTVGYLSRLDKEGNKNDPSIEFIVTAAKMLGVSLDKLLFDKIATLTPTEEFLMGFVTQLIFDTKEDNVTWKRQTAEEVMYCNPYAANDFGINNPLMSPHYEEDNGNAYQDGTIEYFSRFTHNALRPVGNSYYVDMPDGKNTLYLMKVEPEEGGKKDETIMELYLVSKVSGPQPICSTQQVCEEVRKKVENLYSEIEIAFSHVHISDETRSAIQQYMDTMKLPF